MKKIKSSLMSKSAFGLLAAASLCSMVAVGCSDDSSSKPSKGEECAAGLSADCLIGTWEAAGIVNNAAEEKPFYVGYDYSAAKGSITFTEDGKFEYHLPATSPNAAAIDCNPVYGEWTVNGTQLSLKAITSNMCMESKSATVTPTISSDGAVVTLNIGRLYLTPSDEVDENEIKANGAEIFTISAE